MDKRLPANGEHINVFGEEFVWTADHPTAIDLQPLMHTYDKLAANAYDRALEIFEQEQIDRKSKEGTPTGPPPKPDIFQIITDNVATEPDFAKLLEHANTVPSWVDWEQLKRAQLIFYRYAMANMMGLGYQSLFVGMAAARIVEVLVRTGGFSPASAMRRGFETSQWILEIMKSIDSLKPGGDGWASTLRVRLLHSAVRSKITKMAAARPEYFDIKNFGIPINDLDSAATIGSFVTAPMFHSLPRQKIHLRKQEITDYMALWRYVAYLIGAPEHFFASIEKARRFEESVMYYELNPNDNSKILAHNLLYSMKDQVPIKVPTGLINAGARTLAGDSLCDIWDVKRPNAIWRGFWYSNMVFYRNYTYMCRAVPLLDKGNIKMMKKITWKIVVDSKIGLRGEKSKFPMKYKPSYNLTKAE